MIFLSSCGVFCSGFMTVEPLYIKLDILRDDFQKRRQVSIHDRYVDFNGIDNKLRAELLEVICG